MFGLTRNEATYLGLQLTIVAMSIGLGFCWGRIK